MEQIVEKVKALVRDGNASRINIKRKGETLLSISLGAGIIGAVIGLKAAPFLVLTTALVSFGLDCEIEIEKKDGTIINLNETRVGSKLGDLKETAKEKAKGAFGKGFEDAVTVEVDADEPPATREEAPAVSEEAPAANDAEQTE